MEFFAMTAEASANLLTATASYFRSFWDHIGLGGKFTLPLKGTRERPRLSSCQGKDAVFVLADGSRLSVHRDVLASDSPVFQAMFYGPLKEGYGAEIAEPDVEPGAFRTLVRYLYTNEVRTDADGILPLLYAGYTRGMGEEFVTANKYLVTAVETACLEYLQANLSPGNALELLGHTVFLGAHQLTAACFESRARELGLEGRECSGDYARLLTLEAGINVSQRKTKTGKAFLAAALAKGSTDDIRLMVQFGAGVSEALFKECRRGDAEKVRLLLDAGADVTSRNAAGKTPLMEAAWRGHSAVVCLLLQRGADLAAVDKEGQTALHWGCVSGQEATVRVLLDAGADVSAVSEDGWTALHFACEWDCHLAVVSLLLARGADVAALDQDRQTPLHLAAWRGSTEVVARLLRAGAPARTKDIWGGTPLEAATSGRRRFAVVVMLKAAERGVLPPPPGSQ